MQPHDRSSPGLAAAVQEIVDRERRRSREVRRERTRQRLESVRNRLGPVVRCLLWLQMLGPLILVLGVAVPIFGRALSWLCQDSDFLLELLLTYSIVVAAPLVTLLAPASRLTVDAKGRLIIATWVIAVGLAFAIRPMAM